jgi:hypothetical protein
MRNASATQRHNVFQTELFGTDFGKVPTEASSADTEGKTSADAVFDSFDRQPDATHEVARIAGRLNASVVSDEERDAFLAERSDLLDKFLAGTITRKEEIRLEYVRWSLDRIEDARHGPAMDRLEGQIEEFRKLAASLSGLHSNLNDLSTKKKRQRRK